MDCKRDASVQLKVEVDGNEVWLTIFTDAVKSLLAVSPDVSLTSDSDTIKNLLMDLKDITLSYNVNTAVITKVSSVSN